MCECVFQCVNVCLSVCVEGGERDECVQCVSVCDQYCMNKRRTGMISPGMLGTVVYRVFLGPGR